LPGVGCPSRGNCSKRWKKSTVLPSSRAVSSSFVVHLDFLVLAIASRPSARMLSEPPPIRLHGHKRQKSKPATTFRLSGVMRRRRPYRSVSESLMATDPFGGVQPVHRQLERSRDGVNPRSLLAWTLRITMTTSPTTTTHHEGRRMPDSRHDLQLSPKPALGGGSPSLDSPPPAL
jgi:hypothetical protein